MGKRKLGYLPDPPDARDLDFGLLSLASSDLPETFSLRSHVREIYDQGSTSSCVANAFAQAVRVAESSRGVVDIDPPSRLFIYYNSRRQHSSLPVVLDSGTYLRTAAAGLQKLGAPPESLWPFGESVLKVNRRPSFVSYMRAHGRRGGQYYRIFETGDQRILALKAAIYAGNPPVFGTLVGESFLDSNGPDIVDIPTHEKIVGGHAMAAIGWTDTPSGLLFEAANSWTRDYRDDGFVWFTEAYMGWGMTTDVWACHGWENTRGLRSLA